jgi:hypothetical protein
MARRYRMSTASSDVPPQAYMMGCLSCTLLCLWELKDKLISFCSSRPGENEITEGVVRRSSTGRIVTRKIDTRKKRYGSLNIIDGRYPDSQAIENVTMHCFCFFQRKKQNRENCIDVDAKEITGSRINMDSRIYASEELDATIGSICR